MQSRHSSPSRRVESPRPSTHRQRSNSLPIVEALGCSTPEAQLILAEGRAAVRKRRAHGRCNQSFGDEEPTKFHPKHHLKYLQGTAEHDRFTVTPISPDARICHVRSPSNITDRSTSTIIANSRDIELHNMTSPASPLGNYSAHLAQFIKAQLKLIPTYQPEHDLFTTLSPRSCPEFSFPIRTPPPSPGRSAQRPVDAPKVIDIPPVRPPMRSAFSAWSSADDDEDAEDDTLSLLDMEQSLLDMEQYVDSALSKASNYTPSVLGYYESSNNASFLFSSTPLEDEGRPDTAKSHVLPHPSAQQGSASESHSDTGYPSSSLSQPQLVTSSAPSYSSSSASASSYFDYKQPLTIAPQLKDRIIAALTPPRAKTVPAISPWEGGAIANVHDVFVESQQRVQVDGMSFDMLRDFIVPSRLTTPC
jgi:hypothetical protein